MELDEIRRKIEELRPSYEPPGVVEQGLERLFEDHRVLSDFIFDAKKVTEQIGGHNIADLQKLAKDGKHGPNDPPTIWLLRYLKAIREEVEELEKAIAWKWWRPDKTNMQNVRVELIDITHFLLSAAMASGMTGRDFGAIFYAKRKLNFERQVQGFIKGDDSGIVAPK